MKSFTSKTPLLLTLSTLAAQTLACLPPPGNQTSYHPPKFDSSTIFIDTSGGVVRIQATGQHVALRTFQLHIGSTPLNTTADAACGFGQVSVSTASCVQKYTLTGAWADWAACPGWVRSASPTTVTMTNYAHLTWTDVLEGGVERVQSTSTKLRATLDTDVLVDSDAALALTHPATLTITSVLLSPQDAVHNATLEIGYTVRVPCPFTPHAANSTLVLSTAPESSATWAPSYTNCITGPASSPQTFCGDETFVEVAPGTCPLTHQTYTGVFTISLLDYCYADGNYSISFQSAASYVTASASLVDAFDLCVANGVASGLNASLHVVGGPAPQELGSQVYFEGNVTGYGLPLAKVSMTSALVFNTKPALLQRKRDLSTQQRRLTKRVSNPNLVNAALEANGGRVTASSENPSYPASRVIDGARGGTQYWQDDTFFQFPDTLRFTFAKPHCISEVNVFHWKDGTPNPTLTTDCTGTCITSYDLEYLSDSQYDGTEVWTRLAQVSGNTKVWNKYNTTLAECFVTSSMRLTIRGAEGPTTRLAEVEAWGVGMDNAALAGNGGEAWSPAGQSVPHNVSLVNNGQTWATDGWIAAGRQYPADMYIEFKHPYCIWEVDLYGTWNTWSYNDPMPIEGLKNGDNTNIEFTVEFLSPGGAWSQAVQVRANEDLWRKFAFKQCFLTRQLKVSILRSNSSIVGWKEIEAWGEPMPPNVASALAGASASGGVNAGYAIDESYATQWTGALGTSLTVMFAKNECISEINYITAQDGSGTATPTRSMTFGSAGDVDFVLEYTNGSVWWLLENVVGNNHVWTQFSYSKCVLAAGIRARVSKNAAGAAAIVELQAMLETEATRNTALNLGHGWRDKSVFKAVDIDLSNEFGTDGYFVLGPFGNVSRKPNYISSLGLASNPPYIMGDAPNIDHPSLNATLTPRRICFNETERPDWNTVFTIVVNTSTVLPTDIRVGVMVDTSIRDGIQALRLVNANNNIAITRSDIPVSYFNGVTDWIFLDFEPKMHTNMLLQVLGVPNREACVAGLSFDSASEIPIRNNAGNKKFGGRIPDFVHSMFEAGKPSVFGQAARWRVGLGRVDATGNASWSSDAALVHTMPDAKLDSHVPFAIAMTPFSGASLDNAFVTKKQALEADNSFGLQISWRGYFDLVTAEQYGKRSGVSYMLKRDLVSQLYHDAVVEAQVVLAPAVPTPNQVVVQEAPIVQTASTAVIVGSVLGGVLLVVCIASVAMVIARRRKLASLASQKRASQISEKSRPRSFPTIV